MGTVSRCFAFTIMYVLYALISGFNIIILAKTHSSPRQTLCLDHERSALLQFKQSFSVDPSASTQPHPRPQVESWKSTDCCSWDGVECREATGHVIGLDLNSSSLYGSINSSSSLFSLGHLKRLNLADNDFNYSQIPSGISRLSRLSHLDLSNSVFAGSIPLEVFSMANLVSLDLSGNVDRQSFDGLLELEPRIFRSLPQCLPYLRTLNLGSILINSTVPETFGNMYALTLLRLSSCGLYGDFPERIFLLPNLGFLLLSSNEDLTGSLPEFHKWSRIKKLNIGGTGLSVGYPASFANLTQLTSLDMAYINLYQEDLSGLAKLNKLTELELGSTNLQESYPALLTDLFWQGTCQKIRKNYSSWLKRASL